MEGKYSTFNQNNKKFIDDLKMNFGETPITDMLDSSSSAPISKNSFILGNALEFSTSRVLVAHSFFQCKDFAHDPLLRIMFNRKY